MISCGGHEIPPSRLYQKDCPLHLQEQQRAEAAAREHVMAEIHRRAARQAATWAAAQQLAITWLQTSVNADDAEYVEHHMSVVKGILAETGLPYTAAPSTEGVSGLPGQASVSAQPTGLHTTHSAEAAALTSTRQVERISASTAAAAAITETAAAGSTAHAVAVASAIDEAARALAEAKAKATATAEAVLQAAMAQEQQKVLKKANNQLFSPLTQGLVDYPSDEDSHTSISRGRSDTDGDTATAQLGRTATARSHLAPKGKAVEPLSSLLPMYSADLSGTGVCGLCLVADPLQCLCAPYICMPCFAACKKCT